MSGSHERPESILTISDVHISSPSHIYIHSFLSIQSLSPGTLLKPRTTLFSEEFSTFLPCLLSFLCPEFPLPCPLSTPNPSIAQTLPILQIPIGRLPLLYCGVAHSPPLPTKLLLPSCSEGPFSRSPSQHLLCFTTSMCFVFNVLIYLPLRAPR